MSPEQMVEKIRQLQKEKTSISSASVIIEELSVQFPVKECCVALSVSRSGYYQWVGTEQSEQAEADAELLKEIRRVYAKHKA
jgi:hypothetical protein